jgi:hypothetical protein
MTTNLLDYNGLLSEQALTHPSAQDRSGKFMLVERSGVMHLVMGSINVYAYHADLLAQFCRDHEISHEWISRPAHLAIRDDSVKLHGGGWVSVKPKEGRVTFFGKSTAYGPFVTSTLEHVIAEVKRSGIDVIIQR